eukprot:1159440-Pelagomonas_calceolata.AAC.1
MVVLGGSELYGIFKPLPATVVLAGGISRAKLVPSVHVCFKLVYVQEMLQSRRWRKRRAAAMPLIDKLTT